MTELITNLHMHTQYSDGTGTHQEVGQAALRAGLDVVIVTDHNVLVRGVEQYFTSADHRTLLLAGEEIHDQARQPQKNHMLVLGAGHELARFASDPQNLIDQVQRAGGLSFIAHPTDPAMPLFNEDDISWVDWQVHGFTGIELWNGFSELKNVAHSYLDALFYAFFPQFMAESPNPVTLKKWDELLAKGQKIVAVGGSDAHALHKSLGPLHRTVFPYDFHFRAINTHILTPSPLSGDLPSDRKMVLSAFQKGHAFVGYDLAAPTTGFRFTAQGRDTSVSMGDDVIIDGSLTLQIRLPIPAHCELLKDGQVIKAWDDRSVCAIITDQPGVYRVECSIDYLGRRRGWIYSNPIYLLPSRS